MSNTLGSFSVKIDSAAVEGIALHEVLRHHSVETIGSKANADEVIHNHESLGIETLSLLHDLHQHENGNKVEGITNQQRLHIHEGETGHILL